MPNFAEIKNDVVANIIIAESKEIADMVTGGVCVEYTDENPAYIGWIYDGTNFIQPVVEVPQDVDIEPTA
jgi:hypothetical protein